MNPYIVEEGPQRFATRGLDCRECRPVIQSPRTYPDTRDEILNRRITTPDPHVTKPESDITELKETAASNALIPEALAQESEIATQDL